MTQNERVERLPDQQFREYCKNLALQILEAGEKYDFVIVLLRGAQGVWSLLQYVVHAKQVHYVDVTRYPDGELTSRQPPEFRSFPKPEELHGKKGIILDDCVDDGDTMFESGNRVLASGDILAHSGVVIAKDGNLKIRDWKPTFIGGTVPGNIYYDFPGESFAKEVEAELREREAQLASPAS